MMNFFDDTDSDNISVYESLFRPFPLENEEDDRDAHIGHASFDNLNNTNIIHQTVAKEPIKTINCSFSNTKDVTIKNLNFNCPLKDLPKIDNFPHFCSLNTIHGILVNKIGDNDKDNEIIAKIIKDECVAKAEEYLKTTKKININNENENMNENDNFLDKGNIIDLNYEKMELKEKNLSKKKRGRKTENTGGKEHNCYSADNIIKKLKLNCLMLAINL